MLWTTSHTCGGADPAWVQWNERVHFFAVAAPVMRRVLVDLGRRYRANRRGGGCTRS
ncbi:MAG: ECF-type sigma factor [Gemmatimonadaceae bacterium]